VEEDANAVDVDHADGLLHSSAIVPVRPPSPPDR
jgi:hypothetical protein